MWCSVVLLVTHACVAVTIIMMIVGIVVVIVMSFSALILPCLVFRNFMLIDRKSPIRVCMISSLGVVVCV